MWSGWQPMDVFEAVNSRIACRHFLDKPVDLGVVRQLIEGAARAASNSNVQPWNVHALTGEPLRDLKQRVTEAITQQDWRTYQAEFPDLLPNMGEPIAAGPQASARSSTARSASTATTAPTGSSRSSAIIASS